MYFSPWRINHELKQFLAELSFDYVLGLNPGWHRQLGIGVSKGGSYEV